MSTGALKHQLVHTGLEIFARIGMAAKGTVYCLIGILTTMAAFGLGGQASGKKDALNMVLEQPFGKVLLGIIAVGLLGYVVYRFIQAVKDPEHKHDKDTEGVMKRIGYGISALVYLALAAYAGYLVFSDGSGSGSDGSREMLVGKILSQPFGQWVIGAVAIFIIGKGIYDIYKAVSGKYSENVEGQHLDHRAQEAMTKAGMAGYIARGIVLGIIGYFFMRAAIESNASSAAGSEEAFGFLSSTGGPWLMGAVAFGLICYGVYYFIKARYQRIYL